MSASVHKIKNRNRKDSLKFILRDSTKRVRFALLFGGIILLCVGFYISQPVLDSEKVEKSENKEFNSTADEPIKIDKELLKSPNLKDKKKIPADRITIPALGVDLLVKQAQIVNGFWEVFTDSAGWGVGSAYPQDQGNQVLFAHAREGLFLPLKNAKVGQKIYIFAKDKFFVYSISEIKEVLPTQTEVIAPTKDAILTLYTCSGFADSKRLIIISKQIEN